MKTFYTDKPDGYREGIQKGLDFVRSISGHMSTGRGLEDGGLDRLADEIGRAQAIVIGAGAGLSASAGLTYSGERFYRYFSDFAQKYGIRDMYSGGFYPFPDEETRWAWWARHIYFNRYVNPPESVYRDLLKLVETRNYFVVTTNVDHQFQRAGFDKRQLFYTQGDYGLFQSTNPEIRKTCDNEKWVMKAMAAQGFVLTETVDGNGVYDVPENGKTAMRIPSELIPAIPDGTSGVTMNLRSDDSFVEDEGWHRACGAYSDFLNMHKDRHVLFLELGVGANTPVIIKYPFWAMTAENLNSVYVCINYAQAFCPEEIRDRSICLEGDIKSILEKLQKLRYKNR